MRVSVRRGDFADSREVLTEERKIETIWSHKVEILSRTLLEIRKLLVNKHNAYIPYLSTTFRYLFSTVGYVIEGCVVVAKKSKKEDVIEDTRVTDHVLVPKHEILTEEEKKELLSEFNATEDQFPYLFLIDPVAREIGAKPGDMVKITRTSDTAGETTYYRYVVESA